MRCFPANYEPQHARLDSSLRIYDGGLAAAARMRMIMPDDAVPSPARFTICPQQDLRVEFEGAGGIRGDIGRCPHGSDNVVLAK